MADIKLRLIDGVADISILGGDVEHDDGLVNAVMISLLSDGRRELSDPVPGDDDDDPRGWWGERDGERLFSKLWTLRRSILDQATLERAESYAKAALAWMIDDGIASSVEAVATRDPGNEIVLTIKIVRGRAQRWARLWDATALEDFEAPGLRLNFVSY